MPACSHASWCGASSLPMKPRTESRNSSWSASNRVRSMAATVTRWLPAPAGREARPRGRHHRALRRGPATSRPATWRRSTRIHNEVWAEWVAGRAADSATAAYVDIDRFTAHPERMDAAARPRRRRRRRRPRHAFWREEPGGVHAAACSSTRRRRRTGVGAGHRAGPGRRGQRRRARRASRSRWPSGSAEATDRRGRRVPARTWSWSRTAPIRARSPTRSSSSGGPRARQADGYSLVAYDVPCPARRAGRATSSTPAT